MKKFITVFLSLIMVFCCSAIIACKQEQDAHIHEWSTTYTEDGDRHYQTCSVCSEKNYGTHSYNSIGYCIFGKAKPSGGQENPPEHTHNFNERIAKSKFIKKSATCVQKAEYYYSCECGEKGTEFFEYGELASHTPRAAVRENEVPATCKTEGSYNEVVRCSVCNEIISSTPKTINKTPHKYEDGVCTVCGQSENKPHSHSYTQVVTKPTCTERGYTTYTCDCGDTYVSDYVNSTGHTPGAAVRENEVSATCKTEGSYNEVVRCSVCNEIISSTPKTINKTPHKYEDGVCTVCGYIEGLISFKTLQSTEADCVYGKVSNTTSTFSFLKEIKANSDASYIVCTDIACTVAIPSKTVNLETGDNIFYVLAECGNEVVLYTVTIRRRPIYTVTFQTDGTQVDGQLVEEDGAAVLPAETVKTGYTFENWTLDGKAVTFPYTVTGDLTFIAVFSANSYTATLDVNSGNPLKKSEFTIVYGSPFDFPVPSRNGYTFLGWFDGETEVGDFSNWTYAENKAFTAKWAVNENLSNFTFTSTETTLTITGVIDKTVTEIIIPENVTKIDQLDVGNGAISNCFKLEKIVVDDNNKTYCSVDGVLYDKEKTNILHVPYALKGDITIPYGISKIRFRAFASRGITNVIIPESVTFIDSNAFESNKLANLIIPSSVTSIGMQAFAYNKLTSLIIHDGVTSIGNQAFAFNKLTSCVIPDSVTSIGDSIIVNSPLYTDAQYYAKDGLYLGNHLIKASNFAEGEFFIKQGVLTIADAAFMGSSITSIIIPDSITNIGESAFIGCDSLKSIFFNGTAEEWNNISVGTGNESLSDAVKYFYSETEPSLNADGTEYDGDYWHYDTDGVTPVIWKKEN